MYTYIYIYVCIDIYIYTHSESMYIYLYAYVFLSIYTKCKDQWYIEKISTLRVLKHPEFPNPELQRLHGWSVP